MGDLSVVIEGALLNGENLIEKRYWAGIGSNLLSVGLPRTVKLTARVSL